MGSNVDNLVILPVTTARYLNAESGITAFYIRAETEDDAEAVAKTVKKYLNKTTSFHRITAM